MRNETQHIRLKRNGLQNHAKRLARIEAPRALEKLPSSEHIEIPPPQTMAVPTPVEEPESVPGIRKEKVASARFSSVKKAHKKTKFRRSWILTLSNILLLALLVYLGFYTAQNLSNAGLEPDVIDAEAPTPVSITARLENATPLLSDYRIIWVRNLFNISKQEAPAANKEIAVEKVALAKKDLGLKLVGTAVADNAEMSRVFIDNRSTRKQEAYRVGDKTGEVSIKNPA